MPRSPWLTSFFGPGVMRLFAGLLVAAIGVGALLARPGELGRVGFGVVALAAGGAVAAWGFRASHLARYLRRDP